MYVLTTFFSVVEILICFLYYSCFNTLKSISKKHIGIIILTMGVLTTVVNWCTDSSIANLALTIFTVLIVSMFYRQTITLKLFLCVTYIIFSIMVELIVGLILSFAFLDGQDFMFRQDISMPVFLICHYVIKFIIVVIVGVITKKRKGSTLNYIYIQLSVIPALSILLTCIFIEKNKDNLSANMPYCISITLILLIINVMTYMIFYKYGKVSRENYENSIVAETMRYREDYYESVDKWQDEIRKIRHDMKNQLLGIMSNLENDNDVLDELQGVMQKVTENNQIIFTGNQTIDSIIKAKYDEMEELHIKFDYDIKMPPVLKMTSGDIGILFGNAFDNAIESCKKCEEKQRYIKLKLFYYNTTVVFIMENYTISDKKTLKTSKKDKNNHGYGLKSMERIAEKYNGSVNVSIENNTFLLKTIFWNV